MNQVAFRRSASVLLAAALAVLLIPGRDASAQSLSDAFNTSQPVSSAPIAAPAHAARPASASRHPQPHKHAAKRHGQVVVTSAKHHASKSKAASKAGRHVAAFEPLDQSAPSDTAEPTSPAVQLPIATKIPARTAKLHRTPKPAPVQAPSLDSMTRDGSTPDSQPGGQSMNIGTAIVRWAVSLALVLALCAGAIAYLRKKGLGLPTEGDTPGQATKAGATQKPMFGMSPLAQMIMRRPAQTRPTTAPDPPIVAARATASAPIENLNVIASGPLPGSPYTLYKVRIEDRILLLAGAPGTALSVLTEWDVEAAPRDDRRFDSMLDQLTNYDPIGVRGSGLLRSAAQRLEQTTERIASLGSLDRYEEQ